MANLEWIITSAELRPLLKAVTLLDVRERSEHAVSRIEGCKLIPLGEVSVRAASELGKNDDIVIYCAHGVRSMHALRALQQMGFTQLRSLEGGLCAWEKFVASHV